MSDDLGGDMMSGVARVMVRRHLSDLVADGYGTEDQLSEALLAWMHQHSSTSMKDCAFGFRLALLEWAQRKPAQPSITVKTVG